MAAFAERKATEVLISLAPRPRPARLGQNAFQSYGLSAAAFALVGGLHEGVNLQRVLHLDGRLAGLEESRDLDQQRLVTLELAGRRDAFRAEHGGPEVCRPFANPAQRAHAAVVHVPTTKSVRPPAYG